MNKIFTCLFFILAINFHSYSRNEFSYFAKCNFINIESDWKVEYKDAQIQIESKIITYESLKDGMKHDRVVFRYTNLSNQNINILFNRNLVYNGVCYGCNKVEKKFSVQLKAKEVKEFSELNKDKTFYVFAKDLKGTIKKTLDSFQLTNIEKN
jgi:hypothetical protein